MAKAKAGKPVENAEQKPELPALTRGALGEGVIDQRLQSAPLGLGSTRRFGHESLGEGAEDSTMMADEERAHGPKLALLAAPGSAP